MWHSGLSATNSPFFIVLTMKIIFLKYFISHSLFFFFLRLKDPPPHCRNPHNRTLQSVHGVRWHTCTSCMSSSGHETCLMQMRQQELFFRPHYVDVEIRGTFPPVCVLILLFGLFKVFYSAFFFCHLQT